MSNVSGLPLYDLHLHVLEPSFEPQVCSRSVALYASHRALSFVKADISYDSAKKSLVFLDICTGKRAYLCPKQKCRNDSRLNNSRFRPQSNSKHRQFDFDFAPDLPYTFEPHRLVSDTPSIHVDRRTKKANCRRESFRQFIITHSGNHSLRLAWVRLLAQRTFVSSANPRTESITSLQSSSRASRSSAPLLGNGLAMLPATLTAYSDKFCCNFNSAKLWNRLKTTQLLGHPSLRPLRRQPQLLQHSPAQRQRNIWICLVEVHE